MLVHEVETEKATAYLVVVEHYIGSDRLPTNQREEAEYHIDCASGFTVGTALKRMVEMLMDGGKCVYCDRPTAFWDQFDDHPEDHGAFCWTFWDADNDKFRRTCGEFRSHDD